MWFTLSYMFHRFQITLVELSIMLIKERKTAHIFSRHGNTKIIYNTPKLTKIHYSNTDFDFKCFMY